MLDLYGASVWVLLIKKEYVDKIYNLLKKTIWIISNALYCEYCMSLFKKNKFPTLICQVKIDQEFIIEFIIN